MRIESSVTAISWIPSEAVQGLPKIPFSMGVAHYDNPPPDTLVHIETMHMADLFREANELRAWIDVEDGKIVDHGHAGRGRIGVTRLKVGPKSLTVPAVALPTKQRTEVGDGWVKFTQTAGGRTGAPAPRSVRGKPYFQWSSAIAWTTLTLTINADGTSTHELTGASSFPRHWIYDKDGNLVAKSGVIDFEKWYRESHEQNTPWGGADSPALLSAVESDLERELSRTVMQEGAKSERLDEGTTLVEQGEKGDELYLVLDGLLDVEVDGEVVAELGPGTIIGERALLEDGVRSATVRAKTPATIVRVSGDRLEQEDLAALAAGRNREER
jgi:cyclic nucleotide-binding protein